MTNNMTIWCVYCGKDITHKKHHSCIPKSQRDQIKRPRVPLPLSAKELEKVRKLIK